MMKFFGGEIKRRLKTDMNIHDPSKGEESIKKHYKYMLNLVASLDTYL
jgi:hypothetical protein